MDNLYSDPLLVSLYDTLNGWSHDNDFYLNLACNEAKLRILDAGCGTGDLAAAYALNGHDVVAIDPSPLMLDVAKKKRGADLVRFHCSTLQKFRSGEKFDLIVMTGHAFQTLLTDTDISEAFETSSSLLSHGGQFVFETRNSLIRPWERWTPELTVRYCTAPDSSSFKTFHRVVDVQEDIVVFETIYLIEGTKEPVISCSRLRFPSISLIEKLAYEYGLHVKMVAGNWDGSAFTAESPEIIISLSLDAIADSGWS